jgi:hypothetical protein
MLNIISRDEVVSGNFPIVEKNHMNRGNKSSEFLKPKRKKPATSGAGFFN